MSTPNLVTLDNEEAQIMVGSNVRLVTGQFLPDRRRPRQPVPDDRAQGRRHHAAHQAQIGENGTIRMTIFQEASWVAADTALKTSSAGPTTNKRSIEST